MKNAMTVLFENYIDGDIKDDMLPEVLLNYRMAYDSDDENHKYDHDTVTTIELIASEAAFKAGFTAAVELLTKKW